MTTRVLGNVRLSVLREETTSPEKQKAAVEHWVFSPGESRTIVGWAEDVDVSGAMHPFKRPGLGPWFNERADEWDVLAVWKLDRLSRKAGHFAEVFEWCQEHGKTIVSVTEGIDMSTPMGKMFAQIIAAFAEGELDTIRARALGGAQTRLSKGVWVGGVLPFGYLFDKQPDGGKRLVQEPTYAALLRDIAEKVKGDWSPYKIALDLNERGVLTWKDYQRTLQGNESRGTKWVTGTILAVLRNPTVGGVYTYKGQVVEDDEGNPVPITDDPILPCAEWSELVAELMSDRPTTRATPSRSMLGGVAVCDSCGARMSSSKKTKHRKAGTAKYSYYACNSLQSGTCSAPARCRAEDLDGAVEAFIDEVLGNKPVMEKVQDTTAGLRTGLEAAKTRLARLEADYLAGRYDGEGQEDSYWRMNKHLSAKVTGLTKTIAEQPGGAEWVATGKTYRQEWVGKDAEQKRVFLQRHDIEVKVSLLTGTQKGATVWLSMPNIPGIGKAEGLGGMPTAGILSQTFKVDVLPQRERGKGTPLEAV
ncbi:DNA invertase Pin-like site-specific DNA recombinase [Streptomyces sp. 846.5]|nr:recombinase family protein [Streptomyces sp. 846.5]TDU04438.1 DNA invertase Pin-like site-specific DNA recombinase [Streptomyces sp. 846.5]